MFYQHYDRHACVCAQITANRNKMAYNVTESTERVVGDGVRNTQLHNAGKEAVIESEALEGGNQIAVAHDCSGRNSSRTCSSSSHIGTQAPSVPYRTFSVIVERCHTKRQNDTRCAVHAGCDSRQGKFVDGHVRADRSCMTVAKQRH